MLRKLLLSLCATPLLCAAAGAQTYVLSPADIPLGTPDNNSNSENVDFGDLDLDGDFDAVFADGGDFFPDQNRVWINMGGLQGGVEGTFTDQTVSRVPTINDSSRDVELGDVDGDGDLDVFVSNTSSIINEPSRFWINAGAASGTFVDETETRWLGLGEAGSSVNPALVFGTGGGFVNWCGDSEFGDLDADGDLDLVHSSYGGVYGGQVPTRMFRNNGLGFFREFNPSGFQLTGANISDGDPGIWCEGTQQSDTTDATGAFCDVASNGPDVDLGDTDGDLDLDLLHGSRSNPPRMFQNRREENGGMLGFRDITGAAFPPGYVTGTGHYEQEMGDLDRDGDLDIYGLGWRAGGFGFDDATLENLGNGIFANSTVVPNSSTDSEECDYVDYDADGDLDVYIANFSGQDHLYRNDSVGAGIVLVDVTASEMPPVTGIGKDGESCDVDGDGDQDVFSSRTYVNLYLENTSQVVDVHAPWIPQLEDAPDRLAGPDATGVRANVLDNAAYYATWYDTVWLEYTVDGGLPTTVPMQSSGGQVFRGEIPGALVGAISYQAFAEDRYGNLGASAVAGYQAAPGPDTGDAYCFGDGSGAPCPCHNEGHAGHGCANGTSHAGALMVGDGSASVATDDFELLASGLPPGQPGLYFQADERVAGGLGSSFGDGLRCAGVNVVRLEVVTSDPAGASASSLDIAAAGGVVAGDTKRYQLWYRDPLGSLCGAGFNLSNALELVWGP